MGDLTKSKMVGFMLTFGMLAMSGAAYAGECKQIHAQIVSTPIFGCGDSAISLCTSGTIDGNQGLNGTTFFIGDSAARVRPRLQILPTRSPIAAHLW